VLQFNAVTRLKSVAIAEDIKSRDSFSRKPSRAQPESLPGRQSLIGDLLGSLSPVACT